MITRADERKRLLDQLEHYNRALARNDAVPDATVEEVGDMEIRDLRVVVEATGHRLAGLIALLAART